VCDDIAFLVNRDAKLNNDAEITGHAGVNSPDGRLRTGRNVVMLDGSSLSANRVEIGNGSSIDTVFTNDLKLGANSEVRNGTFPVSLPLVDPFCELPEFACDEGRSVLVQPGVTVGPLQPGVYGQLRILNGATLRLAPGEFTFCDVRMGREADLQAAGPVQMNIDGSLRIGSSSTFGPILNAPPIIAYVSGRTVRISQDGLANAEIIAPFAKGSFGRDAEFVGCFCMDTAKSDKHITLFCPETP
jgi:hypothetical protein